MLVRNLPHTTHSYDPVYFRILGYENISVSCWHTEQKWETNQGETLTYFEDWLEKGLKHTANHTPCANSKILINVELIQCRPKGVKRVLKLWCPKIHRLFYSWGWHDTVEKLGWATGASTTASMCLYKHPVCKSLVWFTKPKTKLCVVLILFYYYKIKVCSCVLYL